MIRRFRDKDPQIHPSAFVADDSIVIGDVEIGDEASVWFGSIVRGDVNFIRIGDRTNIQDACVIHVSSKDHPTILEHEITVGHRVTLHGCYVEAGCLIGIGSIILDGADRAQFSGRGRQSGHPGTVIPAGSLIMGAPAKVKRPLTSDELDHLSRSWKNYVELSRRYISEQ